MRTKGIGPNNLGMSKSPAKMMASPAKVGPGRKGKRKKGEVNPKIAAKREESTRESDASAFRDSLKEKNAIKAEKSGDVGRAQRIRSRKDSQ